MQRNPAATPLDGTRGIASAVAVNLNPTHRLLRDRTHDLHIASEKAFAAFDLRTRAGYAAFLTAQAGAVIPLEDWLDCQSVVSVLPDWPDRRRAALLRADLDALGTALPGHESDAPRIDGDPLGVVYVLEGARHGARILARVVQASDDAAVVAATRFLAQPGGTAGWPALLDQLDRAGATPARQAELLAGADFAFRLFRQSAVQVAERIAPRA